jgi:hypothetical protein
MLDCDEDHTRTLDGGIVFSSVLTLGANSRQDG